MKKVHGTMRAKISGQWRYDLWNPDGSAAIRSPWGDNVITDLGIAQLGVAGQATIGVIGDSTVPPDVAKSTIGNLLAIDTFPNGWDKTGGNGSPNYEYWHTTQWQFAAGVGTGTINELGCSPVGPVDGSQLFSHHLVTPGIPKAANQILDTYYRLIIWPTFWADPSDDIIGTGIIDGETYNTAIRGLRYSTSQDLASVFGPYYGNSTRNHDGELAAITALTPLGTSSGNPTNSYHQLGTGAIANGGYMEFQVTNAIGVGNIGTTGVRSIEIACSSGQSAQCRFGADGLGALGADARIPKDYRKEMTLDFRYEWTRK